MKEDPATRLIDVRTNEEYATAHIEGAMLVNQEEKLEEILKLPKDTPLVVHCHHGVRSLSAAGFLMERGFTNVFSMKGGIEAWSQDVDPSVPHY